MSNPLFQMMNQGGPMNGLFQRFQQFQQMFKGDPQKQVQQLLNSGKVSQQDYDRAVQMANQLQRLMSGRS